MKVKLRTRGFTLLELVIAIIAILALATALLERLRFYQGMAERAKMESELRTIKTGLQVQLAVLIVTNRQAEATTLESEDPVKWMDQKPGNYGGTYHENAESGAWYFDERARQLVYVVNYGHRLVLEGQTQGREIRFQARLLRDRIRVAGGEIESVTGVALSPVYPYRWS
jgi:prepilin-type N-terminal cleavage/methylation domain-containing protein